MSYRKLEIWQRAREVALDIHQMTLTKIPKFEMYEVGSQIRRSSKSTTSNIVEGYGRRIYPAEFFKFLIIAIASNDETIDHLKTLYLTKSLTDEELYKSLKEKIEILGKKINNFIQVIEKTKYKQVSQKPVTSNKSPVTNAK